MKFKRSSPRADNGFDLDGRNAKKRTEQYKQSDL